MVFWWVSLSGAFPSGLFLGAFLVSLDEPRSLYVIDGMDQRPRIVIDVCRIYEVIACFSKSCLGSLCSSYLCYKKDPQYNMK